MASRGWAGKTVVASRMTGVVLGFLAGCVVTFAATLVVCWWVRR